MINQANHQLDIIEKNTIDLVPDAPQTDLFLQRDKFQELLREIDPDTVTPKQALDILYKLRDQLKD